jgi:hypothetical protein
VWSWCAAQIPLTAERVGADEHADAAAGAVGVLEVNEIEDPEIPIGDAGRELMLAALLRRHPTAVVAALDIDGHMVELPLSVPVAEAHIVPTRSPLDLLKSRSRAALFGSWERVKQVGVSMTPVVLINGVEASCYVIDVRNRHGVLVGLTVADVPIDVADTAR